MAHLHFEMHDCNNAVVDTNASTMWDSQPLYNPASDVMDVMLRAGAAPTMAQIKDPVQNPVNLPPNATLGVGLSLAVRGGDSLSVRVTLYLLPQRPELRGRSDDRQPDRAGLHQQPAEDHAECRHHEPGHASPGCAEQPANGRRLLRRRGLHERRQLSLRRVLLPVPASALTDHNLVIFSGAGHGTRTRDPELGGAKVGVIRRAELVGDW